jgi:O-antigen/teichoic acid export membrane protein
MKVLNVGLYFFSSILKGLFPFLLLPILTNAMSTEEFGIVGMFQTFLVTLTPIIGLKGFGSASIRYYQSKGDLSAYNNACVQILTVMLILLVIIISFVPELSGLSQSLLFLCVVSSGMKYLSEFRLNQWMIRENVKVYAIYQVLESLVPFLITIFFIYLLNNKIDARVYAISISSVFFAIIAIYSMQKSSLLSLKHMFKFNYNYIKECLQYGVPLLPHVLSGVALISIDRYMISYYLGFEQVAFYIFSVTFAGVVSVFFTSANKVYSPWLYRNLASITEAKIKLVKQYTLIVILISIVAYMIGINFIEYLVLIVSNQNYLSSVSTLKVVILGQMFNGFYLLVVNFILYSRKTKTISIISMSCLAINVLLLLFLVPNFGILGAAYSFLISTLIKFILTAIFANSAILLIVNTRERTNPSS